MAFSSVKDVFAGMPSAFDASAAAGADVTFQFNVNGDQSGQWNVVIKDGACEVNEGVADSPTVAITMEDQDFLALINGELNGVTAFMSGKLKATGDIMAAQKLNTYFKLN